MIYIGQIQDVVPITSYDTAGSFLLLGCQNGSVYYIGKLVIFDNKVFTETYLYLE